MYSNFRSIMNKNKRDEIETLLLEKQIDILGITESWTHSEIEDSEINFYGYTLLRKDREYLEKEMGGGVLLYIREGIGADRELDDLNYPSETVWVKFKDSLKNDIYIYI